VPLVMDSAAGPEAVADETLKAEPEPTPPPKDGGGYEGYVWGG
jgi:hypothetical protein